MPNVANRVDAIVMFLYSMHNFGKINFHAIILQVNNFKAFY
ncbi:hypothetical protein VFSR5_A0612 [Aliivibrio fischeri SR5]|uniref:Uncharacterized protein n=1 Tax=Aliivibrio fischeri SR5 TaxID=1088719 RepID=A0AAV3EMP4_ALIFS|nr:hypothetical protein VFSR5_A0612 [Aliivibrio fischeri SR5]